MVREQTAGHYHKDAKNYENTHDQHAIEDFSWSFSALDLVEIVLRPPGGGPPSFPDDSEPVYYQVRPFFNICFHFESVLFYLNFKIKIILNFQVLSALNLLRFLLIKESTGKHPSYGY
jgi:hypothetical protein